MARSLKKIDVSKVRIPGTKIEGVRAIGIVVLGVYILLFLILNNKKLSVNFVFFSVASNELLALVVICALSFLGGFVIGRRQPRPPGPPRELPPPDGE